MRGGAALVAMSTLAAPVYAQPSAASDTSASDGLLAGARAAWDRGEYDIAEPLYRQAIEHGGLNPTEVLDAYVRLGSARAVLGKSEPALAAFKAAALLDHQFTVPPEAGRKASQLAEKARKAESQVGAIVLHADVPATLAPGEVAELDATLDDAHAAVAYKVAVLARDPMTGKSYQQADDAAPHVHFKLPAGLALPNAILVVRVDALDGHGNRLASVEQRVQVSGVTHAAGIAGLADGRRDQTSDASHAHKNHKEEGKKGGFWSSAWPYVIGGAALAAGGAAVYLATRPGDDVNVGSVHVLLTP